MDIAVFVGFASSGPLHLPVPIEDVAQFESVFGEDAPLAWDRLRGERARSLLGPAVRSFFANGGRRCWVIRVAADTARSSCFPMPGLAVAHFDQEGELTEIEPAFARARSEGSWADGLACATGLCLRSLQVSGVSEGGGVIHFPGSLESAPRVGDLLRLTFEDPPLLLFAPLSLIESVPEEASPAIKEVRLRSNRPLWFERIEEKHFSTSCLPVTVHIYTARCPDAGQMTENSRRKDSSSRPTYEPWASECEGDVQWREKADSMELRLKVSPELVPSPGALVRLDPPLESPPASSSDLAGHWWFTVESIAFGDEWARPPHQAVTLFGQAVREVSPSTPPPEMVKKVKCAEVLEFDLRVRHGLSESHTLRSLGFAPGHVNYWNMLPTDSTFYGTSRTPFQSVETSRSFDLERPPRGRTHRGVRFPLAGMEVPDALFLPLGMDGSLARYLQRAQDKEDALARDGLATFDASLFLDPDLVEVGTSDFMAQADFLRYLSPSPRPLRGMHAALGIEESSGIEEATLIAVPDAVHPGWEPGNGEEWWNPLPSESRQPDGKQGVFSDCWIESLDAPAFEKGLPPDGSGSFKLRWSSVPGAAAYRLEESGFKDFAGAVTLPPDRLPEATLYGRNPGCYFYRVRAERGSILSPWSDTVELRVGRGSEAFMVGPDQYSAHTLLSVHRALLRMCAGRGELLAVMALPRHYREEEAIAHVRELKRFSPSGEINAPARRFYPGEATALSYGALYHPWLMSRTQEGLLLYFPPDGAACGVLAARAISRGSWIAPANEPLREVVAIEPRIGRNSYQSLQRAQINLVRQEPRGFIVLSADTLSEEPDLVPINVRRLLILLRRLALRRGATYVFEPLGDQLRRTVERAFEALLHRLFEHGAFAGATPEDSYRVAVGSEINTPRSMDRGKFLVELRVAPSMPMTFLTIRLIQAGERLFALETR